MVVRKDYRRVKGKKFYQKNSLTTSLIFVNIVAFILFFILIAVDNSFLEKIAVNPESVLQGTAIWTIFTSMFMHGGFFHLFVNMFSLFFLGSLVERIIGRKRFLWFYLTAGIVGSLFFVLFAYVGQFVYRGEFVFGAITDSAVGASGAIFGLLGLLAVLLPRKEIYLIVGPLMIIILQFALSPFVPPNVGSSINLISTVLIFVMIFSLFSPNPKMRKLALPLKLQFWITPIIAIVPLVFIGFFVKLPIGNTAHFGGLVVGLIYGFYLRNKYSKKVKMLNKVLR